VHLGVLILTDPIPHRDKCPSCYTEPYLQILHARPITEIYIYIYIYIYTFTSMTQVLFHVTFKCARTFGPHIRKDNLNKLYTLKEDLLNGY